MRPARICMMKIAVFCGSNFGNSDIYREAAAALGVALAEQRVELVFGGTNKGLMKIIADAVLESGGTAHGIVPQRLVDKGQQYPNLTVRGNRRDAVGAKAANGRRSRRIHRHARRRRHGGGAVRNVGGRAIRRPQEGARALNVSGFFDGLLGSSTR